jgi:phospholipid/cholesterol/gamma-HCH transport system substrate-binding protein
VYDDMKKLTERTNTLVEKMNSSQGTMGKLMNDPQLYDRLNTTVARLDVISARIEKGEGTLGKLSTDPTLFNNLNESSKSLRDFLTEFMKNPKKYLTVKLHIF